ncbi:MAG: hypothetical protein ACD_37C00407G0002 [uncultured bacterium]|nr:MAG: hypothetical protein ACD_37C00407G0002 [uncultured bacterium]OGN56962.1 MAG: hypothetical protein A2796_06555 [Chlamydiae bacterium RIFCSPHIGHO2_01_FULL_44_39]OGN58392.1 MAG: hypothetical protein A3C42_04510 [Chlamydiae bacterium RIFCSPHIGHO2_02_FULL_45_9]OGN59655.1 MAG: hypothetical protein A3D96_06430 [Chlamydiae bacterium RIFCSPHIGHO2_12_FULL_44_59]OGN65745.1 MAG: hypothetical protein A2978_07425 [Chlamydiae bacterium RIFCSPLOWO2_01_FULL_44_52]OGN67888.1 MAG: hypothetical protein A3
MSYTIRVQKSPEYLQGGNPDLLVKNFNSVEEFQAVSSLCDNKRRISWLESLIIPVRTDTLGNFCQDFFLPGLFNKALKVKDVAIKMFLCVITFPIRLITVIPRCIYNVVYPKEAHPFYQYLINNGVAAADLSAGHVYLETEWMEGRRGLGQFEGEHNLTTQGNTFNFMHLPKSVSIISRAFSRRGVPNPAPHH